MKKLKTLITLALVCFLSAAVNAQAKKTVVKKATTTKTTVRKTSPVKQKILVVKKEVKLPGTRVKITTDSGVIVIRLYDKTPQHRDNFIKLANEHFSIAFYFTG